MIAIKIIQMVIIIKIRVTMIICEFGYHTEILIYELPLRDGNIVHAKDLKN